MALIAGMIFKMLLVHMNCITEVVSSLCNCILCCFLMKILMELIGEDLNYVTDIDG